MSSGRKPIPMLGREFGCLKVLREAGSSTKRSKAWVVQCSKCGALKTMFGRNIRRVKEDGTEGCLCEGHPSRIHGLWDHPAYDTWEGMMARCYKATHPAFHRYGGRGITVCTEWHDPSVFIPWLIGMGWQRGLQIDRIDNDGGYSPSNCRVVHPSENSNNKSTNRLLVIRGERLTISQASTRFGIGKTTIKERLNRGWNDEDAVRPV